MSELLDETLGVLRAHNKQPADVQWVGSINGDFAMLWAEFEKIADVEYNSGFGCTEVAIDLVVVGSDWWLERYEYDGDEQWMFKTLPQKHAAAKSFNRVVIQEYQCGPIGLRRVQMSETEFYADEEE